MIGAKEFAIGRKIIEKKKINPLLEKITMPKFMGLNDAKLKGLDGAFDKNREESQAFRIPKHTVSEKIDTELKRIPDVYTGYLKKSKNPLLEKVALPDEDKIMDREFDRSDDIFPISTGQEKMSNIESPRVRNIPKVELSKKIEANAQGIKDILDFLKASKDETPVQKKKEPTEMPSEEVMNRLTCRVFETIRNYLDNGRTPNGMTGGKQIKIELNI